MRALAVVFLTVLVVLAGLCGGEARAGFSKVKYTLTMTYTTSWASSRVQEGRQLGPAPPVRLIWGSGHDAYVLRSVFPFWVTRTPGAKPIFAGSADLVGIGGKGFLREDEAEGILRQWHWWDESYPMGGLYGSAGFSRAPGRVSFSFTTTPGRSPMRIIHWSDPAGTGKFGYTSNMYGPWLYSLQGVTRPIDLRRNFGRTFTATFASSKSVTACAGFLSCSSNRISSATLTFTPVAWVAERRPGTRTPEKPKPEEKQPERQDWQVDVRGMDRWSWGVLTGLQAGVEVDWLHRTTLEIADGKIVSAKGKVIVEKARSFSVPPGVFTVTSRPKTWPAYELISAMKSGNRVTLILFRDNAGGKSFYNVKFTAGLAGPQALDLMRKAGLPDPEVFYQRLVDRGPITDSVTPITPYPARLVFSLRPGVQTRETEAFNQQLSCEKSRATREDCFRQRGGQIVTVTKLR